MCSHQLCKARDEDECGLTILLNGCKANNPGTQEEAGEGAGAGEFLRYFAGESYNPQNVLAAPLARVSENSRKSSQPSSVRHIRQNKTHKLSSKISPSQSFSAGN